MRVRSRKLKAVANSLVVVMFMFLLIRIGTPHPPIIPLVYAQETSASASIVADIGQQNWTQFWIDFNSKLEWKMNDTEVELEIERFYIDNSTQKVKLKYKAKGVPASYNISFQIDGLILSYEAHPSEYYYILNYAWYSVVYNWSDISTVENLVFNSGVENRRFYFEIIHLDVAEETEVELDPSIVASVETTVYGHGFQRKSFHAEGYFFQFYGNSSLKLNYKSSSDGDNWGSETYFRDGTASCFSLWFDGTYVHTVYVHPDYGGTTYYRRGDPENDGSITWDDERSVYDETGWFPWEPSIAVDSSGYPYIFIHWEKGTTYRRLMMHSDTNDGTWSSATGYPMNISVLNPSTDIISGVVLPLTSGKMYAIWSPYKTSTKYYGRLYDGTWQANETICDVDYHYLEYFSAVSRNDDIHMVLVNNINPRYVDYINYTSGSWGNQEHVTGLIGASESKVYALSIEDADTEFYVYYNWYFREDMGYWTDYLHGTSGSWSSGTYILWESSQNPASTELTSFRQAWGGFHSCSVVTIDECIEIWIDYSGVNPTIGEFEAPSTVYAFQQVTLNATVSDAQGNTTLKNASLTLSVDSIVLKWVNNTNTFSMDDSDNKWEFVSGSRSDVNSTSYKLTWRVKSYWNSTEGYVSISEAKVYDGDDYSGINSESNWFYNENDLIIQSANVDDNRVNPTQALTFTGQIYYESSSIAPYTTSGITAKIELTAVLKGSNSSIASDGSFIISFNAESTINQHGYNVYCTTAQNSEQNKTVNVVVDRLVVTILADDTNPPINIQVSFTVTAIYDYDDIIVTSWTVNILRNSTHFATGNFTDTQFSSITYEYTTENVTETTYGLTNFTSNTVTVTWGQQAPTIGEFQAPSTVKQNEYFSLTLTINDKNNNIPSGNIEFVNATVQISHEIILKWDNATNTFTIHLDTNSYCSLWVSNSTKTTVNSTAYELSWKIRLNENYPQGLVDVIAANTKVMDSENNTGTNSYISLFTFEVEEREAGGGGGGGAVYYPPTIPFEPPTLIPKEVAPWPLQYGAFILIGIIAVAGAVALRPKSTRELFKLKIQRKPRSRRVKTQRKLRTPKPSRKRHKPKTQLYHKKVGREPRLPHHQKRQRRR